MLPLVEEWPRCSGCEALDLQALHLYRELQASGADAVPCAARLPDVRHRRDLAADTGKMTRKPAAAVAKLTPLGVLSDAPGRRALDFGCGAGTILDVLQDAG